MYLIVRKQEIAPGIWGSKPVTVARTPNVNVAQDSADRLNTAAKHTPRRLRERYAVIKAA